jgi:hypothetical protein
MDTGKELVGQAEKAGKLDCDEHGNKCDVTENETKRCDAPAFPYGNPPEAGGDEPPESSPPVSSFA